MTSQGQIDRALLAATRLGLREARELIVSGPTALADHSRALPDEELEEIETLAQRLEGRRVHLIGLRDEGYPAGFRSLRSPPPYLFAEGSLSLLANPLLAFSGSRDASPDALETTSVCAGEAASAGFVVSAGLARGVDRAAHAAALADGAGTVAVLPEGILRRAKEFEINGEPFVPGSSFLAISQFPAEADWAVGRAMARNRTLVALSSALVVAAAGESGGSLEAGRVALKMGKKVLLPLFGVPPASGLAILDREGADIAASREAFSDAIAGLRSADLEFEHPVRPDTLF